MRMQMGKIYFYKKLNNKTFGTGFTGVWCMKQNYRTEEWSRYPCNQSKFMLCFYSRVQKMKMCSYKPMLIPSYDADILN